MLPEEAFSSSVLRNDIVAMLADITENMDQEQSPAEQRIKSEGEPGRSHYSEGAIVLHVESRVGMGVSPRQFVSEFRRFAQQLSGYGSVTAMRSTTLPSMT
jgi:hypothetical protein